MKSLSFFAHSVDDLQAKARSLPQFKPALGIFFSSPSLGMEELALASRDLGYPVFGCSTDGEFLSVDSEQLVSQQSAACCLLDVPAESFALNLFEKGDDSSLSLGKRIGEWGVNTFDRPAFVIGIGGLTLDGEAIIRGMESTLPPGTRIIGGTAGDDGEFAKTWVFSHESLSSSGVVAIAFDTSVVDVASFTASGWTGVGTEMTVTSSDGNIVRAINGKPAVDLLVEYLKIPKEELISVAVRFPLIVRLPDGDELIRAALAADFSTGAVIFAGSVPQGSKVRFSSSFGYETIETTVRDIREFHGRNPHADVVLVFSCTARHYAAGSMVKDEITAISEQWGAPLIGFFTYGEIGHNRRGSCNFCNETLSIALLRFRS